MKKKNSIKNLISNILSILSFCIAIVVYGIPLEGGLYYILASFGILLGFKGNHIIGYIGMVFNALFMTTLINYLGSSFL